MTDKPWQPYRVGTPSTRPNWTNNDCRPFDEVSHVTHIANAMAIIPGGTIKPQLIDDESRLNTRRLLVNWVSPNNWGQGFLYGNVSFDLDWNALIDGKNLYWVEVMPYRTPACRILVTDTDYTGDPDMIPYDPTEGDGPWWFDQSEDIHFRNGEFCLEFMLEFELSAASCKTISLVKHRRDHCCIKEATCADKGMDHQEAAARFLAGVISEDTRVVTVNIDNHAIRGGWWWLMMAWPKTGYQGAFGVEATDEDALALARSALAAYYQRNNDEFLKLARLFSTQAALESSAKSLVKTKFPNMKED